MRLVDDLINTIQNELCNRPDWEFDGRRILGAYQKEGKLVLRFGEDSEIAIRFEASGKETCCSSCGETKAGYPDWWRNVGGERIIYACPDCVSDHRSRNQSHSKASELDPPGS